MTLSSRRSCAITLAAAAVLLCSASVAAAKPGGGVVTPARGGGMSGGELLGEVWARGDYSGAPNPLSGTCETIAPDVLEVHYDDDLNATCSATPRSRVFLFFGSLCFSFEEGSGPSTEEQLACAVRGDEAIDELNVTIDDDRTVALVRRKFELFSPQRTAQLPEGPSTFTAHAWGAVVRNLHPGRHTVELELVAPAFGGTFTFTIVLEVS